MDIRLDKKTAMITGGSAGIGKAIALSYIEAGANVAIIARHQDKLDQAKSSIQERTKGKKNTGNIITVAADVRIAEQCRKAVNDTLSKFKAVDILVNNAGTSQRGDFLQINDDLWKDDLDLKLFAAIRLSRLLIPGMRERKWGRIINVLNLGAKAPNGGGAPTAVSRAAGMALMKILAHENAPHNILVNGLLVGRIKSEQWERRHANDQRGLTLEEWYDDAAKTLGLGIGRFGTSEEFANIATFLASERGSYINGTAINVDGGSCPMV